MLIANDQNYQNTNDGFSVARFSRHSRRNVEPSSMCKSGAPTMSATASALWSKKKQKTDDYWIDVFLEMYSSLLSSLVNCLVIAIEAIILL